MLYSNLGVRGNLFGRFCDALFINEYDTRHDHRLCFRARLGQSSFDEKFVDALAFHIETLLWSAANCHRRVSQRFRPVFVRRW